MFRTIKYIFALSVIIFGVNMFSYAQKNTVAAREKLIDKQVKNIQIKAQGIEQLFSFLSLSYDIPIGLEVALNDNDLTAYTVDFKEGKFSDLLIQIINQINQNQNQYDWEIEDNIVNIFPKTEYRDSILTLLLEANIDSFLVKEKTSCETVIKSLVGTANIKKILYNNRMTYRSRGPNGFYIPQLGRSFTLNISDMTLKSMLNRLVKESPIAKFWIIKRNTYDSQTFFISIDAKYEDLPLEVKKPTPSEKN